MRCLGVERIMVRTIVGLFLALLLPGTGTTGTTGGAEVEDEEYAVTSAALEHSWSGEYRAEFGSVLVVLGHTTTGYGDGLRATLDHLSQASAASSKRMPKPSDPKLVKQREAQEFKAAIGDDAISDWTEKNTNSYRLANRFHLSAQVVVPSEADWKELDDLKKEKGLGPFYEAFRSKYPESNAIIRVSRVGFNRKCNQAVVEVGYTTGPVGGEGDFLLVAKQDGVWKVQHVVVAWMS
jgi:hypothetical protein